VERKRRGLRVVRDVDVLPETVAHALGTSCRAAEVALWGPMNLARRCARVITALKAAGADEALVRFIQPIDQALHAAQPAAVTEDMPCRELTRSGATVVARETGSMHGG
jgi:hypothetical protein